MTESKHVNREFVEKEIENCKKMILKINGDSNGIKSALVVKCVQDINEQMNKTIKTLEKVYNILKD